MLVVVGPSLIPRDQMELQKVAEVHLMEENQRYKVDAIFFLLHKILSRPENIKLLLQAA